MILGNQCSFPCARCVLLLCSGPVYEWISGPTKHSHSDRLLHVAIHFVVVVIRIHTNGSTDMLILCFQLKKIVGFSICIRITQKWNLSLKCHWISVSLYMTKYKQNEAVILILDLSDCARYLLLQCISTL